MEKVENWWKARRFGCISLALSLAEIAAISAAVAIVQSSNRHDIARIRNLAADVWLLGGIGALVFAVAGLVLDTKRLTAFLAAISTVLIFFACGTQFLV